jgi:hypothetical protein
MKSQKPTFYLYEMKSDSNLKTLNQNYFLQDEFSGDNVCEFLHVSLLQNVTCYRSVQRSNLKIQLFRTEFLHVFTTCHNLGSLSCVKLRIFTSHLQQNMRLT